MLYILRHGKTDWNAAYKIQGSTDIPLNDEGREMALRAANENPELSFDVCYCSPLSRAVETAEIFLKGKETPIITDERLREMGFGGAEGTEKVFEKPDLFLYKFFNDPAGYIPEMGAESIDELYERTGCFLKEMNILSEAENKNILIVGHGAMNCSIINRIRNVELKDFWKYMTGNCELVRLL